MKTKRKIQGWLIAGVMAMILFNLTSWDAYGGSGDDPEKNPVKEVPDGVRVGYAATFDKVVVDYPIEQFGYVGGAFSRMVPVYEFHPCCRQTNKAMDGCSAPKICAH